MAFGGHNVVTNNTTATEPHWIVGYTTQWEKRQVPGWTIYEKQPEQEGASEDVDIYKQRYELAKAHCEALVAEIAALKKEKAAAWTVVLETAEQKIRSLNIRIAIRDREIEDLQKAVDTCEQCHLS